MSKVKIQGNASGTGVLTVTAPNTSTDRTITLPDATGTLATTDDVPSSITDNGDATAITIDSSENVGIGVTPAMASASYNGLHIGATYPTMKLSSTSSGHAAADGFHLRIDSTPRVEYWNYENTDQVFANNNGEKLRIQSGGGISFNGDTAAANALDNYEEGVHLTAITMGSGTASLSSNQLSYTKIGRVVHVCGQVRVGSVSSPDGMLQMSMPFTVASGNTGLSVGNYRSYQVDTPNDGVQAVIHSEPGQALATLQWSRDGSTPTEERATSNGYFMIGLTYMT